MNKKKVTFLLVVLILVTILAIGCQQPANENNQAEGKFANGTHKAELEPDERGWKSTIDITVEDGKITAVNYDEVNEEGKKKSEDKDYAESMKGASGVSPAEAYEKLEADLISKQDVDKVETVTGATGSSDLFREVSKKALKK